MCFHMWELVSVFVYDGTVIVFMFIISYLHQGTILSHAPFPKEKSKMKISTLGLSHQE